MLYILNLLILRKVIWGWGFSSMTEHLPNTRKALGLVLSSEEKKKQTNYFCISTVVIMAYRWEHQSIRSYLFTHIEMRRPKIWIWVQAFKLQTWHWFLIFVFFFFPFVCFKISSLCSFDCLGTYFLFKFLLILCEFHIMHPSLAHLSIPSYLPFALAASPLPSQTNK